MRTTFLNDVAKHYIDNFPDQQQAICLIFPNRRAGTFFKQELLSVRPGVQWMPDILATEDFVRELTHLRQIDSVTALFEFYTIYQETEAEKAEPFDVFSTWATQLIHDFQEIDLYCVDAKNLFGSVDAAYAMKNWSPDGEELTANQQQYLRFWSRMGLWYNRFREHLTSKNLATSAMAYRYLAENIQSINIPWNHLIFAGFNALNASEQTIIKSLENRGKATMLWDVDSYYVNAPMNEAGLFVRNHLKKTGHKSVNFIGNRLLTQERKIHITGVAKNIGQTLVAGSILDSLAANNESLSDTALVLCDEPLLMPMLEVLPDNIQKANITMGYPLHLLPVSSLFSMCFDLQLRSRMVKHEGNRELGFYFKDVQRILRNPVFAATLENNAADQLIQRLEREREIFMPVSKLLLNNQGGSTALAAYSFLFTPWENSPSKALESLSELSLTLRNHPVYSEKPEHGYESEALFEITSLINRINNMMADFHGFASLKTLHRVFTQLLKQLTLPFIGEPLEGMQIMGLLETRNLDFKNLILLSVNENILPAAKSHQSFIPFDIALGFGLPTYRERDAVYAYHFYRMIQRAENVWLVYNTESDEFGKGEKSRYITQLLEELKTPTTTITSEIYVPVIPITFEHEIRIKKDNELIEKILNRYDASIGKRGLSPTSIASYLKCSLQFYFNNFSNIKTDKLKEEEIGADEIGNVAHQVLEELFKPFVGKIVSSDAIAKMLLEFEPLLDQAFKDLSAGRNFEEGKNMLIKHGTRRMIIQQLEAEIIELKSLEEENKKLTLISVEDWLEKAIEIDTIFGKKSILLKGKADRIDKIAGELRVIDYKTGNVETRKLKLNNLDSLELTGDSDKALQLLQYIYMASNVYPSASIRAGIMSLRMPSEGIMEVNLDENPQFGSDTIPEIEALFERIIEEMVSPSHDFEQTQDLKQCGYCDFAGICNR
jgi:ATP-dependent helicase/nuclease subunit B